MIARADYNFIVKYGEVTPDGVAVYDLNSRAFVYMNRFLSEMVGLARRSRPQPGDELVKFVHPDDMSYVDQRYRELLSIGCIPPVEFRIVHPDNGVRHVTVEVLWLEESYTFALFAKDITILRQYEDYVEKISAQKDTLLDILLHNLSGPLYFSRDVLRKIAGERSSTPDIARLVSMLTETNSQCIDIINQFLQEEHTESLNVEVRKTRFDVIEKSSIVVDLLAEAYKTKKLSIKSALKENYVVTDVVKFCQVLHNLLSNSVKYTREDGNISVHVTRGNNQTVITVADDGPGIPEELKPLLFTQKVSGTPGSQGEPSRGVGLFLCAKLVKLMGGRLTLERSDSGGSVFALSLPDVII